MYNLKSFAIITPGLFFSDILHFNLYLCIIRKVIFILFSSTITFQFIHQDFITLFSPSRPFAALLIWLILQRNTFKGCCCDIRELTCNKIWHLDYSVRYHWLPDCCRIDCYWFQSATDFRFWHHLSLLKKNIHTYSFWSFSQHAPSEGVWLWNGFRLLNINRASWLTAKSCQIRVTGPSASTTFPLILLTWPYSLLKGYFHS